MACILCCMKSKDSYNRIVKQFASDYMEFEEYIADLDIIRGKISYSNYDLAILDVRLWWKDDAVTLLNKFNVKVIEFSGDFEEIFSCIRELAPVPDDTQEIKHDDNTLEIEVSPAERIEEELNVPVTSTKFITVEKVLKTEVIKERPVYTPLYTSMAGKLLCVMNLSKRAGSTFVTLNLAKFLASIKVQSCVIEPPLEKPYIFDSIGLDLRLLNRAEFQNLDIDKVPFYSYPHEIMNAKALTKGFEVVEDGIAWIIGDSRKPIINDKTKVHFYLENLLDTINSGDMESIKNCLEELKGALNAWDYYKTMKLIYAYRAGIQIVDVGNNFEEKSIKPIVNEADLTLVVIDPMPVECSQNSKRLDELLEMKKNGFPIEFVVNRFENTVDTEQLKEFIRVTPVAYIPAVDLKYIYKAVYNYKIPFEIKEVEEAIIKPLYQIAKLIIPDELLKDTFTSKEKADKKPFSFGSLLRRLKK